MDAHVHLFNSTDVDVSGYLKGPVAHNEEPLIAAMIRAAAPLLERIGHDLPLKAADELRDLCKLSSAAGRGGAARNVFEQEFTAYRRNLAKVLARQLPGTPFQAAYETAVSATAAKQKSPAQPIDLRNADELEQLFAREASSREGLVEKGLGGDHPDGVLAFLFLYMLSPRRHNLIAFQNAFADPQSSVGVDACFSALVDFDYWLGCAYTPSNIRDQVLVHEQLAILSSGYVLPLAPYNPWTDIERGDESLDTVRWAIKERGCVGVKIYPPMGFRPFSNTKPLDSSEKRPDGELLDKKLDRLYQLCMDLDVPVMAHAYRSHGRDKAHDTLGEPDGWVAVLARYPDLRVNLGHFGGDVGDWPGRFVREVMKAGRNVYGDLGYRMGLGDSQSPTSRELARLLKEPLPGGTVSDRVMYGSDWHMIAQEGDWQGYANRLGKSLVGNAGPQAAEKVLGSNAIACFGLKAGANRTRLEAHYERHGVSIPAWMSRA